MTTNGVDFKTAVRNYLIERFETPAKASRKTSIPLRTMQRWFIGQVSKIIEDCDSVEKAELLIELLQLKKQSLIS